MYLFIAFAYAQMLAHPNIKSRTGVDQQKKQSKRYSNHCRKNLY